MFRRFSVPLAAAGLRSFTSAGMDFLFNPTSEHSMLRETISKFGKERVAPQAAEYDQRAVFNKGLFKELADLGVMGITVPAEDGGAGMDSTAAVIIHHELSRYDPGFCLAYLAHSMLFVNNFYHGATKEQRQRWLSGVLSGDVIACMCMTEPGAGTDVLGMQTTAVRDGTDYVINGSKTFITNGPEAGLFLVYAKVNGKITAFVVERGTKGLETGAMIHKLGCRASSTCPVYFDNVRIPKENLLGSEGKGAVHMMRNLEIERLTLAAMGVGIADECVELMVRYADERKAFGQKINNFGQIQRFIADGFAMTEAAKALTYSVARSVSVDTHNRLGSDASKLFAAPVSKTVADYAIETMGGMGYTCDMPVERLWRDAKLLEIGGGTLEAHQKNITKDLTKVLQ